VRGLCDWRVVLGAAVVTLASGHALALQDATTEAVRVELTDPTLPGSRVALNLANGDTVRGVLLRTEEGGLVLRHTYMGEVRIPRISVISAFVNVAPRERTPTVDDAGNVVPLIPQPVAPTQDADPVEAGPSLEPEVKWQNSAELGIRGSSGNTERFNLDAALTLRREDSDTIWNFSSVYDFSTSDGEETANRFDVNTRFEWKLDDPRWTVFVQGRYELDEFQSYDYRVSGAAGVGYKFIENDKTFLQGRVGLGASREFGDDANEEVVPELLLGLDFRQELSDNARFEASTELFPGLDDGVTFRAISAAALEFDVTDAADLSFRVGVEHRYNSEVDDGVNRSDIDYFARVVWNF
jgi:putative salt-induced outer membrane protein